MRDPSAGILASELRHVIGSLHRLIGAPVHDAWMPAPGQIVLSIGRELLLIEHHPVPRVHTIDQRPPNPATPYSFQGLLRARLAGSLSAVAVADEDRVVDLVIGIHTIHARLFGRGGGLWLVEHDKVIASAAGPAPETLPPLPAGRARDTPPRFDPLAGDWDRAARDFFEPIAAAVGLDEDRRALRTTLGTLHARERRLVANLTADLERAGRAGELRRTADGLAMVLHTIGKGARHVDVPDPDNEGHTLPVELDPARPPSDALTRLYDKAGRLDRAADGILDRLDTAERRATAMADAIEQTHTADPSSLAAMRNAWAPARTTTAARASTPPFRTWHGPSGQIVHVGRDARSNHALVFKHARGRDWWLHVRDKPGAHVVLPMSHTGDAPPLDQLLVAAQIVLAASGAKLGEAYDVIYARVSSLRPIKGEPGKVIVRDERVLHVRRELLTGWVVG